MSEKRIVIIGNERDSELVNFSKNNTCCRENVDFVLLNTLSEIGVDDLEIFETADLILAFFDSYDEAITLYRNIGCEIKNKFVCLLEKKEKQNSYDVNFSDKIIQWIYPGEMKIVALKILIKMFCTVNCFLNVDLEVILKMSLEAPEATSEIFVHKGKREDVYHEIECLVKSNESKECSFFSLEGNVSLVDVSDLYEILKNESGLEYRVAHKKSRRVEVLTMWK